MHSLLDCLLQVSVQIWEQTERCHSLKMSGRTQRLEELGVLHCCRKVWNFLKVWNLLKVWHPQKVFSQVPCRMVWVLSLLELCMWVCYLLKVCCQACRMAWNLFQVVCTKAWSFLRKVCTRVCPAGSGPRAGGLSPGRTGGASCSGVYLWSPVDFFPWCCNFLLDKKCCYRKWKGSQLVGYLLKYFFLQYLIVVYSC